MSQITTLEASKILGCNKTYLPTLLRRYKFESKKGINSDGVWALFWDETAVEKFARNHAAARGVSTAPREPKISPFYTTREVTALFGMAMGSAVIRLEARGLVAARKPKKSSALWLKTDIDALKLRIDAGEKQMRRIGTAPRADCLETPAAKVLQAFIKQHGAYPYERPELLPQWCDMLERKAV